MLKRSYSHLLQLLVVCAFISVPALASETMVSSLEATSIWQDEYRMMWIGTHNGLYRYDGVSFKRFVSDPLKQGRIYGNNIRAIQGDGKGAVYVINKFALSRFDIKTERFTTIRESGVRAMSYSGSSMYVASNDEIMVCEADTLRRVYTIPSGAGKLTSLVAGTSSIVAGTDNGLYYFSAEGSVTSVLEGTQIVSLFEDSSGLLWVSTRFSGAYAIRGTEFVHHFPAGEGSDNLPCGYVYSICESNSGDIWISTLQGICVMDGLEHRITRYSTNPTITSFCDSDGKIWSCTPGGITLYDSTGGNPSLYPQIFGNDKTALIDDILEDVVASRLFIASEESGVICMDLSSGQILPFPANAKLSSFNTRELYLDKEERILWVGTRLGGLDRVDLENGEVRSFSYSPSDSRSLPHDNACRVYPFGDSLVVATGLGTVVMDKESGECRPVTLSSLVWRKTPIETFLDSSSRCWISVSGGMLCHNLVTGEEREYFFFDHSVIGTNNVCRMFEDAAGSLWFGTSGSGLLRYIPESDGFVRYSLEEGNLAGNYVYAITQGRSGTVIACTDGGVCRVGTNSSFMPVDSFIENGMYVLSDGTLMVAGYKKLVSFKEDQIPLDNRPERIFFTSLEIEGQTVEVGSSEKILTESLLCGGEITLPAGITSFSVCTSSATYPAKGLFSYRLYPAMKNWKTARIGEVLDFSALKPGKYELQTDFPSSLAVTVRTHWYSTRLAYIIYLLFTLIIIISAIYTIASRRKLMVSLEQERREKRMFAYISHEVRTPVTLIQSQIDNLLQCGDMSPESYSKVLGVQHNLARVSRLLSEVLDFKQQKTDVVNLSCCNQSLSEQLERLEVVFREYAVAKKVAFSYENTVGKLMLYYDPDQMDKVFYNLMSNAFKNTPEGGWIKLSLSDRGKNVAICVSNNGEQIPHKYAEKIFEPFFQVPGSTARNEGTGLGLSIARGIVDAHSGSISCTSENGITEFTVLLPRKDFDNKETVSTCIHYSTPIRTPLRRNVSRRGITGGKKILIVEDNDELLENLSRLFAPSYEVWTAGDGLEALSLLSKMVPDIIISDLMMPNMDGNELFHRVRSSKTTSKIPFVMLTAMASEETALNALKDGADDYICKPFNSKILLARINGLVAGRERAKGASASVSSNLDNLALTGSDKEFVEKVSQVVMENISNPDFDVESFSSELSMGRSSFFNKMKAITGMPPNRFVASMRLNYAKGVFAENASLSTSEVSYMCGFNTPSYFIKLFKKAYGITPTEYKESLTRKKDTSSS